MAVWSCFLVCLQRVQHGHRPEGHASWLSVARKLHPYCVSVRFHQLSGPQQPQQTIQDHQGLVHYTSVVKSLSDMPAWQKPTELSTICSRAVVTHGWAPRL